MLLTSGAERSIGVVREPLAGRREALASLHQSFVDVRDASAGHPVLALVHGPAGIGKTALAQRLVDEIAAAGDALVLPGRCYDLEIGRCRALDGPIDHLARRMARLPASEIEALLPADPVPLARLFPRFRRIEAVARAQSRLAAPPERNPQELRSEAMAALVDLASRMSSRRPIVFWIDDLQWGDVDSAHLLRRLLRAPEPMRVLLVCGYRDEDRASSECLQTLLGSEAQAGSRVRDVPLTPLAVATSRDLVLAWLGGVGSPAAGSVDAVVAAAAGNPFALRELAAHVVAAVDRDGRPPQGGLELDGALQARVALLPASARRLAEIVAVAGCAVPVDAARRAAAVRSTDIQVQDQLRAGRFLRDSDGAGDEIEIRGHRMRGAVMAGLSPSDLKARHEALALALEAHGGVEPERLAYHHLGAGNAARAAELAADAGAIADGTMAFDRAVRLYQWALTLEPEGSGNLVPWRVHLGDVLAHMGRSAEAAEAYLAAAAAGAEPALRWQLTRRAAEQLIRSGRLDAGLRALTTVLDALGVELPATALRARPGLVGRRALVRLRGVRFRPRERGQISPADLFRIDTVWSTATSLGVVDDVRAVDFQSRHLLLALGLGEPSRVVRALAAESAYSGRGGSRSAKRTAVLVAAAHRIADGASDSMAHGWAALASGVAAYQEGRLRAAADACQQAETVFHGCVGVAWEIACARLYRLWSMSYLGELHDLARLLPIYLEEAESGGDVYTSTNLRTGLLNQSWLHADDPARARSELAAAMSQWSRKAFHAQQFWDAMAGPQIDLYVGDAEAAWRRVQSQRGVLARAGVLRRQAARIEWCSLRARCALALATRDPRRQRSLARAAAREAARLAGEGAAWGKPFAALVRAGLAALAHDEATAVSELASAATEFSAADMSVLAALARRRWGERTGGAEGATAIRESDALLTAQGVKDPVRLTALWTPGL